MANTPKSTKPARTTTGNVAVQHYFDDLVSPMSVPGPQNEAPGFDIPDEKVSPKIALAERLLAKANSLNYLLGDISDKAIEQSDIPSTDALLTTPDTDIDPTGNHQYLAQSSEKLAQNENIAKTSSKINTRDHKENPESADITYTDVNVFGELANILTPLKERLPNVFQVLLCDIENVTIAIPLVELGGIHQLTKISPMAKQPSWCKGIFIKGSERFTCIDAYSWLVPARYGVRSVNSEYKFAVQLGKSPYVLCCDSISTTLEVSKGDVKWRNNSLNRPWLAGLLKEKMCALIDSKLMVQEVLA